MAVIFDWPDDPPPKKGKKRKKTDEKDEQKNDVRGETKKEEKKEAEVLQTKGFAAVTGRWSNDITIYKGSIDKDNIAAVLKGVTPFGNPGGCEYAHSEVIFSLVVIATSPRLTLASASLDGSIRTWELYSTRDVTNGYVLKKPRKGAGDWTCACVMHTPVIAGSSIRPSSIKVVEENTTIAVKCDERILLYSRGRYTCGHEPVEMSQQPPDERGRELSERFQVGNGPHWSCMATLFARSPTRGSYSLTCFSVLSTTELAAGCHGGTIQFWTHDGSNNHYAWGEPLEEDKYDNPNADPKLRCSNLTLKGHTESVVDFQTLSLPFSDMIVSISDDHTIRLWRKNRVSTGGAKNFTSDSVLKGFQSSLSELIIFPERQEFACYSGGAFRFVRIDQKESTQKLCSTIVATVSTGAITCATKLSSDIFAVGFMNTTGPFARKCTNLNVQIWRRNDAKGGKWSMAKKDSISGLPNSTWGIIRELTPASGDNNLMRLRLTGGGGNRPSFDSTWQETKDGAWENIATVITKKN